MCVVSLQFEMTTCCQKCGDAGYLDLLIYCSKCQISAEHRYCMEKIPDKHELVVYWLCELCKAKSFKVASPNKRSFDQELIKNVPKCQYKTINGVGDDLRRENRNHLRQKNTAEIISRLKPRIDTSRPLEIKMAIESDVSKDKLYSFNVNDALRIARSKKVENSMDSSRDNSSRLKRRKLILADDDQSDEDAQSDCIDQDDSPRRESHLRHNAAEVVSRLKPCDDTSRRSEIKMAIESDVSKDKLYSFNANGDNGMDSYMGLRIAHSSGFLWKKVDNVMDSSRDSNDSSRDSNKDKNSRKKRRKLILADDDQSDEDAQYECVVQDAINKNTVQSSESILELPSLGCAQDSNKDKNSQRKRRKLILADDDQSDEEAQSDCVDQDAINKNTLQSSECILGLPSLGCAHDSINNAPDEVTNMLPIASAQVVFTQEMQHRETCDAPRSESCYQASTEKHLYSPARPIVNHSWRGCFNIGNEEFGPLTAHLSSRACEKVRELTKLLPPILHIEKLSRLDSWPNSFRASPPTDDSIALYFLPDDTRAESVLDQLLDDVIKRDLALKVIFDEVELLIFSSVILPEDYHRFLGKYYPWGVFRRRQVPIHSIPANCLSKSNELTEERCKMGGSQHIGEVVEPVACDAKSADCVTPIGNTVSLSQSFTLFGRQVLVSGVSAVCPSKLNGLVKKEEETDDSTQLGEVVEAEDHDAKSSDSIPPAGNDAPLSQPLKLFGWEVPVPILSAECPSELKVSVKEMQKLEDSEHLRSREIIECHGKPFDLSHEWEDSSKSKDEEFLVHIFDAPQTGDDGACLELFPLRVEDMAISSRIGNSNCLDLKLRFCW